MAAAIELWIRKLDADRLQEQRARVGECAAHELEHTRPWLTLIVLPQGPALTLLRPAIHSAAMAAERFDVIVLGSGIAGLSAPHAAARMGLRPLVLEKAERIGGITVHSYGIIWVGCNHLAQACGLADDRDDVISYMRFIGGGQIAEDKMLAFVDRAPEALRFFAQCGIAFRLIGGLPDHYFGTAPGSRGAGRSLETELIAGNELGPWRQRVLV
ncbi:MAG: FAD-dependent oxidoreductase, partial [Alphaproteobacteria bacterium]|nr:FAD-dependent oxidoreductase [Alphaproteobacteria bacterium]